MQGEGVARKQTRLGSALAEIGISTARPDMVKGEMGGKVFRVGRGKKAQRTVQRESKKRSPKAEGYMVTHLILKFRQFPAHRF